MRQAASLAIDRQALNQAETLGFSKPTGSLIPRALRVLRSYFEPDPFDPARRGELLAEAGYPNGFDAGDLYPWPPYFAMGEALATYLQNVGIRTKMRTMERAALDRGVARAQAQERDRRHQRRRRQRAPRGSRRT